MGVNLPPPPHPLTLDGIRQHALRQFHVALADAGSNPCDLMVVGDSIGEGALNSAKNERWLDLLRDKVRARWQPAGVTGGYGYVPSRINISGYTNPFVNTGGTSNSLSGLGLRTVRFTSAGNLAITETATTFRLFYFRNGTGVAGSFSYALDGGSATTVSTAVSPSGSTSVDIATGSAASHTLTVSWVSGTAIIEGVMVLNGDESAGVRVWDASSGGATTQTFQDTAFNSQARQWLTALGLVNPDLVLVALGGNDASYQAASDSRGNTPDEVAANLLTTASLIRANANPDPSIAFVVGYDWPNFSTGLWAPYRNAIYGAAISDGNIGVLDLYQRFGAKGDLFALGLVPDGVHLTALGSGFYANAVAGYLEP